jgi:hypothetical protein
MLIEIAVFGFAWFVYDFRKKRSKTFLQHQKFQPRQNQPIPKFGDPLMLRGHTPHFFTHLDNYRTN